VGGVLNGGVAASWSRELRRNNLLPLAVSELSNVLVVGPTADSLTYLCGGWTIAWQGKPRHAAHSVGAQALIRALRWPSPIWPGRARSAGGQPVQVWRDAAGWHSG